MITPDPDGRYTSGHLRRAGVIQSLIDAGIPLDGLAAAMRVGQVSLEFLDAPTFERFTALSGMTFTQAAGRTGVPVELLLAIREISGAPSARPEDRIREAELPYVEWLDVGLQAGIRPE